MREKIAEVARIADTALAMELAAGGFLPLHSSTAIPSTTRISGPEKMFAV